MTPSLAVDEYICDRFGCPAWLWLAPLAMAAVAASVSPLLIVLTLPWFLALRSHQLIVTNRRLILRLGLLGALEQSLPLHRLAQLHMVSYGLPARCDAASLVVVDGECRIWRFAWLGKPDRIASLLDRLHPEPRERATRLPLQAKRYSLHNAIG